MAGFEIHTKLIQYIHIVGIAKKIVYNDNVKYKREKVSIFKIV